MNEDNYQEEFITLIHQAGISFFGYFLYGNSADPTFPENHHMVIQESISTISYSELQKGSENVALTS